MDYKEAVQTISAPRASSLHAAAVSKPVYPGHPYQNHHW